MKEITRIHLAKIPYEIELDAKKNLQKYLDELRKYSDEEIFEDVEIRITEILAESGILKNGIISNKEVEKIRAQIGEPEIFKGEDFEEEISSENFSNESENQKLPKKLYRDRQNKMIEGVLAGIAGYFDLDATIVRLVFVLLTFVSLGATVLAYVILAIIVPPARNASDILRLRGQKISANSIKEINKEYNFEKLEKRDTLVKRILAGIGGMIAICSMLGGISALILGNFALTEVSKNNPAFNAFSGTLFAVLANVAGVAFVAFCATLALAGFTFKFKRSHAISLLIFAILGIICGSAMIVTASQAGQEYYDRVSKSLTTKSVKIDTEKLSKVKNLQVSVNANVEYIVSNERKIEVSEFSALNEKNFEKLKLDFDGENLKIELPMTRAYPFSWDEKVKIYGPELSKIDLKAESRFEYKTVSQANLEVVQSASSNFEFDGQTIENLKISQDYYANFEAGDTLVKNLNAKSRAGNFTIEKIENANFETRGCSPSDGAKNVSLKLERGTANAKILLNGKEFDSSRTGECFIIYSDEFDF